MRGCEINVSGFPPVFMGMWWEGALLLALTLHHSWGQKWLFDVTFKAPVWARMSQACQHGT